MIERKHYSYAGSRYVSNETLAVVAFPKGTTDDHADDTSPEAIVTINLEDYCIAPATDREIFIPVYKMIPDVAKRFVEDLCDPGTEPASFPIGPYNATVWDVTLSQEVYDGLAAMAAEGMAERKAKAKNKETIFDENY